MHIQYIHGVAVWCNLSSFSSQILRKTKHAIRATRVETGPTSTTRLATTSVLFAERQAHLLNVQHIQNKYYFVIMSFPSALIICTEWTPYCPLPKQTGAIMGEETMPSVKDMNGETIIDVTDQNLSENETPTATARGNYISQSSELTALTSNKQRQKQA